MRTAAPNDRAYLESLNLKALQKGNKPAAGQSAREFYQSLQQSAKDGPLFGAAVLRIVENAPALSKPTAKWLGGIDPTLINARDLNLILDWVKGTDSDAALASMTWQEAMKAQAEWHETFVPTEDTSAKYKTHDVDMSFPGGWDMVLIEDSDDLKLEGSLMEHCVGNYCDSVHAGDSIIYSLRDPQDHPHATIEVAPDKRVRQIYGFKNTPLSKKYHKYVIEWLEERELWSGLALIPDYKIPDAQIDRILDTRNEEALRHIAEDTRSPQVLEKIHALNPSMQVTDYMAHNDAASPALLEAIAKKWVFGDLPQPTKKRIAFALVRNDVTPTALRAQVVRNQPATSYSAFMHCRGLDFDPKLLDAILDGVWALPDYEANQLGNLIEARLKSHYSASAIRALAKRKDTTFQLIAAEQAREPDVLDLLAYSKNDDVRWLVAENRHTSSATLLSLLDDSRPGVVNHAAANDNLTMEDARAYADSTTARPEVVNMLRDRWPDL